MSDENSTQYDRLVSLQECLEEINNALNYWYPLGPGEDEEECNARHVRLFGLRDRLQAQLKANENLTCSEPANRRVELETPETRMKNKTRKTVKAAIKTERDAGSESRSSEWVEELEAARRLVANLVERCSVRSDEVPLLLHSAETNLAKAVQSERSRSSTEKVSRTAEQRV